MYDPIINSVLVEINDEEAKWSPGHDESMLGKSYSKGTVIKSGSLYETQAYPVIPAVVDIDLVGKAVMWNEGTEAGTVFEHKGKIYGMIYWWDIRGVKA